MTSKLICAALLLLAPQAAPAFAYNEKDFDRVQKFDAHVHANAAGKEFGELARKDGFSFLTINVDYPEFPPLPEQAKIAEELHQSDPEHFLYSTTFSMKGWGTPGWADQVNKGISDSVAKGAVAVKFWKNIGMIEKGADGKLIMLDNPGFDPIVDHIQKLGVLVIGHQGEPKNCWLPLDQMTTENDRSYFKEFPQYHMYLHPDQPSYEDQMAARDKFLERHKGLRFVGAHLASLEWSVDRLAAFLDANPSAVADMAARTSNVQAQSLADRDKVRNFFIKYQDRILYGSDVGINPGDTVADDVKDIDEQWRSEWAYYATDKIQHIDDLNADVPGLALPDDVIDKIYGLNARKIYVKQ